MADGRGVRYTPAYHSREYQGAFQQVFQDSPLEDFALHDVLAQAGVPLTFDLTTDESTEKFVGAYQRQECVTLLYNDFVANSEAWAMAAELGQSADAVDAGAKLFGTVANAITSDGSGMIARFVLRFVNERTGAASVNVENLTDALKVAQHHLHKLGKAESLVEQTIKSHLSPTSFFDEGGDLNIGGTGKDGKKGGKRGSLISITKSGRVVGLSADMQNQPDGEQQKAEMDELDGGDSSISPSSKKKKGKKNKTSLPALSSPTLSSSNKELNNNNSRISNQNAANKKVAFENKLQELVDDMQMSREHWRQLYGNSKTRRSASLDGTEQGRDVSGVNALARPNSAGRLRGAARDRSNSNGSVGSVSSSPGKKKGKRRKGEFSDAIAR